MSNDLLPPDDHRELDPAVVSLPAGSILYRVHPDFLSATDFNPGHGDGGRFHFIKDGANKKVPSLYAAETPAAALAETVFHDVPIRPKSERRVRFSRLEETFLSEITTLEDLQLVELHHPGLSRLNLEPRDITDTNPSEYPRTRCWAQQLYRHGAHAGLVWMARLYNTNKSYTFFGDRVSSDAFEPLSDPLPLWHGPGLDLVYEHAEASSITVTHP